MKHLFIKNSDEQSFKLALESIYEINRTVLIFSCANDYVKTNLDPILQSYENNIIGAIFPEIIYHGKHYSQGALFILLDDMLEIKQINNIRSKKNIDTMLESCDTDSVNTIFVFADALSKKMDDITYSLFENFGLFYNYIGAGAGNTNSKNKNDFCIISNQGLNKECAIVGFSTLKTSLGVAHGWKSCSPTMKVTKSTKNIIEQINYNSAYEEYKNIVSEIDQNIEKDDFSFSQVTKNYPIGIKKLHNDISIIRDPILTDEKDIVCIGDVQENCLIHVMHGTKEDILSATKEASIQSYEQCDFDTKLTLYFSGISRLYLLENNIQDDIDSIQDDSKYIMGALCLGEIANIEQKVLDYHNRTTVIAKVQTYD